MVCKVFLSAASLDASISLLMDLALQSSKMHSSHLLVGRPLGRFPVTFPSTAILGYLVGFIRRTWPKYLSLLVETLFMTSCSRLRDSLMCVFRSCLIIKIFMIRNRYQFCIFLRVFITLQSIGKNKYGKTGHSKIFYFFEALLDHFEAQFFTGFLRPNGQMKTLGELGAANPAPRRPAEFPKCLF